MKLIIQNDRIAATATDEYQATGIEQAVVEAPTGFDISRISDYQYVNDALVPPDRWAEKNLQINEWRATANQTTFPYSGKLIACDALSRSDIDGVANSVNLNGGFPTGFPMGWKCTDNTYVSIPDIATFKLMYSAMTSQGSANFAHAQALKASLAAATTQEQVDAIVW